MKPDVFMLFFSHEGTKATKDVLKNELLCDLCAFVRDKKNL